MNVFLYDVCEGMINIRESGSNYTYLNECVFESGNIANALNLNNGFGLLTQLSNQTNIYKTHSNFNLQTPVLN